jgi:hypothetical protein
MSRTRWNRMSYNERATILDNDETFKTYLIGLADGMAADIGTSGAILIALNLMIIIALALILWRVW